MANAIPKAANGAPTKQAAAVAAARYPPSGVPVMPAAVARVSHNPMGAMQSTVIGGVLVSAIALLLTQLLALWPSVVAATSVANPAPAIPRTPVLFGLGYTTFSADVVLIAMVLVVGALGALVGVSRRFLHYASRDELTKRDQWSYLMRPLQGSVLALIVYFTLRGGYLGQDQSAPVNPYGIAALSALVGLFTRHAVSKLTDVFDTLFGKPREDENIEVIDRPAASRAATRQTARPRSSRTQKPAGEH
jgi:hypothetical protein